jgi:hypothetical protein
LANPCYLFRHGGKWVSLERGGHARLTDAGIQLFDKISEADSVMVEEKDFLDVIAQQATERTIDKIMRMEQLL